jgi:hypothetical protein
MSYRESHVASPPAALTSAYFARQLGVPGAADLIDAVEAERGNLSDPVERRVPVVETLAVGLRVSLVLVVLAMP